MIKNDGKKEMLIPKLRFPEFRDAPGWEELPLSELVSSLDAGVSVNSGDRPATACEIGVLKTSAVTNGIFEPQENKVVLDPVEIGRVKEAVCGDTIIISRMNTPALVGANAYVETGLKNIFLPDRLWAAKSKPGTSIRFVAFILGSNNGRAALSKLAKGSSGSMKNITKPDVLAVLVMAPSPAEQQRIAACLRSIDELIGAERQKLDVLKAHKKGLMQQLFPREGDTLPRLRFPEFRKAKAWRKRKISEVLTKTSIPVQVEPERMYREIGIRSHGKGVFHKEPVSGAVIADKRVFQVVEDALVLNIVFAWERAVATTSKDEVGMIASHRFPMYVPKSEGCDVRFMKHALLTPQGKNLLGIASPGGAGRNRTLGQDIFEDSGIIIPDQEEQARIADCIRSVDEPIASQTAKLESVKNHKRGLMQQLFPAAAEAKL